MRELGAREQHPDPYKRRYPFESAGEHKKKKEVSIQRCGGTGVYPKPEHQPAGERTRTTVKKESVPIKEEPPKYLGNITLQRGVKKEGSLGGCIKQGGPTKNQDKVCRPVGAARLARK